MTLYGHFSDDGHEYVITRPDTPRPWTNYLSNGSYCALISHTGGGYSFIGGPGYDRITRSRPGDAIDRDLPGRYVMVRDNDSGEYWSITWQPIKKRPDEFECRHSPGVTTISSRYGDIAGSVTYFVPLDDNYEIWRVRLENRGTRRARLSVFTYQEWVLGNYLDDLQDRTLFNLFNEVYFRDNYIVATKRIWRRPDMASVPLTGGSALSSNPKFMQETLQSNQSWEKYAFISMTAPVEAFDCDREAFLGTYGSYENPDALVRGACTNSDAYGRDAVGVLQHSLELGPGEVSEFDVIAGVTLYEHDIGGVVARLSDPIEVTGRLEKVKGYWSDYLGKLKVSTPDRHFDLAANTWSKYQSWVTGHWSRMVSNYTPGSSYLGFRECCHDMLGVLPVDTTLAKSRTVSLLQHQYEDGSCVHYWEPRSNVGIYTGSSDDPLWMLFAVISYLKESGDAPFLDERVKYYHGRTGVTVYDHMVKAVEHSLSLLSPRCLSLIGTGDWDRGLDQVGREAAGESVITSQLLAWLLQDMIKLADFRGDRRRAGLYRQRFDDISGAINTFCWDGAWYTRAIDDNASPIGSRENSEGSIFLSTQSWAVISGTAAPDRALQCMDSAAEILDTPFGPAATLPAYSVPNPAIGTISRLVPGVQNNGGIVTVSAAWAVIAECLLGRGDRAYELFKRSLFTEQSEDHDRYKAEPYVHAEYVCGPDSTRFGEGGFTWMTGAAPWMWRVALDYILGVRPEYTGLLIDPCIPSHWEECHVVRGFRNAVYDITIRNPEGVSRGVSRITASGTSVRPGQTVPDFSDGRTHKVLVEMGKTSP